MAPTLLICPGIGNSGPKHWQSLWEQAHDGFVRVGQRDWYRPVCTEWVDTLEATVRRHGPDAVFVAHSLACLAIAHWACQRGTQIRAAFLVAVPDATGPSFPSEAQGFGSTPMCRLPFPSLVVASTDDPYASLKYSMDCATAWGSRFVNIGRAGHINADSGFGDWPEGYAMLQEFLKLTCG